MRVRKKVAGAPESSLRTCVSDVEDTRDVGASVACSPELNHGGKFVLVPFSFLFVCLPFYFIFFTFFWQFAERGQVRSKSWNKLCHNLLPGPRVEENRSASTAEKPCSLRLGATTMTTACRHNCAVSSAAGKL